LIQPFKISFIYKRILLLCQTNTSVWWKFNHEDFEDSGVCL
jgi:hypothetical protein